MPVGCGHALERRDRDVVSAIVHLIGERTSVLHIAYPLQDLLECSVKVHLVDLAT